MAAEKGRGGTESYLKAAVNEIRDFRYGRFRLIHQMHNGPILARHWYNIILRNHVDRVLLVRHRMA